MVLNPGGRIRTFAEQSFHPPQKIDRVITWAATLLNAPAVSSKSNTIAYNHSFMTHILGALHNFHESLVSVAKIESEIKHPLCD